MASPKVLLLVALLLAGALWAVYGGAVGAPFVFDDGGSVNDNSSIKNLWPLVGDEEHPGPLTPPKDIPTSGRPLVNLSLALNYRFGQLNPAGYRLFNLVAHLLSALLLMAIVRRILLLDYFGGRFDRASGLLAFLVALLWALHPLQTETVVYITQRTELLVGFFYLANSKNGRTVWLVLATLACLAGMACKEVMVTAPVVVLLFQRTFISESFRSALRKSWPLYVGLALGWALLLALNWKAPRSESAGFHLNVAPYAWWFTQMKVLVLYLKLAVWPWPLAIHYEMPYLTTLQLAWPWLAFFSFFVITIAVLLWRRSAIGFVGAWMLLILSPTLVVPIITEVAAERRMYLPLAALIALVVVGAFALAQRATAPAPTTVAKRKQPSPRPLEWLVIGTALILSIASAAIAAQRLSAYRDELTLWQDNVDHQPDDSLAYNNLGNAMLKLGRTKEAEQQYARALELDPVYSDAYANMAAAYAEEGRLKEAAELCRRALQIKPTFAEGHCNLGVDLARLGEFPEAIAEYHKALELKPDYFNAYYNLGNALLDAGRASEALEQYAHAIRLNPNDSQARYNFANALRQCGDLSGAIRQYQAALRIKPNSADVHNNLGNALLQAGQVQEAIDQYQSAIKLRPEHARTYANMAIAYALMHRSAEARSAGQKAVDLARSSGQADLAAQFETWLKDLHDEQPSATGRSTTPQNIPTAP
jgi:tetratricopeptide (TPR) repeat protein